MINILESFITELDSALKTLLPPKERVSTRPTPAQNVGEAPLSHEEKKQIAGLMRVNHAGEVCAQALYQGQALTAQLTHIKQQMSQAAAEETDHLSWCEKRLYELDSQPSLLNPVWYLGSLIIGAMAGLAGDKVSLGFVAETERQVSKHLQEHLDKLPQQDEKTKAILKLMQADEQHHAQEAINAGAIELPYLIKQLMSVVSKVMTRCSYHI